MNTIKWKRKGKVKIIAHRGVSGLETENTCPAFVVAGVKDYYGIETDVHVTQDGKYVVFHDDDLTRMFGLNKKICECTFAELRSLQLKDTDDTTERKDLFIPSLQEYLVICKKYSKQAILELKGPLTDKQVEEIVQIVDDYGWLTHTTFISFAKEFLLCIRKAYPQAIVQFLTGHCTDEEIAFMISQKMDADLHYKCITKSVVKRLHNANLKVNCWTVNTVMDAKSAQTAGVDYITTNILE